MLTVTMSAQNAASQGGGAAQGGGGKSQGVKIKVDYFISQVDTDKDGPISNTEWEEAGLRDHVFITLDVDKNEYVNKTELEVVSFPSGWDANKDGILTLENIKAYGKIVDSRESSKAGIEGNQEKKQ